MHNFTALDVFIPSEGKTAGEIIAATEQHNAEHNRKLDEANTKPPSDQDIQDEYYQLRAEYTKRQERATQAEATCNRAAERVRFFENRLKLLREGCTETDLANKKSKGAFYNSAVNFIAGVEEDLADSVSFFDRMKAISVDAAKNLKAFNVERFQELKPIVAKQDVNYSFVHGTARTQGWGRW